MDTPKRRRRWPNTVLPTRIRGPPTRRRLLPRTAGMGFIRQSETHGSRTYTSFICFRGSSTQTSAISSVRRNWKRSERTSNCARKRTLSVFLSNWASAPRNTWGWRVKAVSGIKHFTSPHAHPNTHNSIQDSTDQLTYIENLLHKAR